MTVLSLTLTRFLKGAVLVKFNFVISPLPGSIFPFRPLFFDLLPSLVYSVVISIAMKKIISHLKSSLK